MLRLITKFILLLMFIFTRFLVKFIILGLPFLLTPLILFYASYLRAESVEEQKNTENFITIPVPLKPINKGTIISEGDLVLQDIQKNLVNDMIAQDTLQLIGQETKKTLFKNKPILLRDVGSMTIIRRNDTVTIKFQKGAMILQTLGRAMQEGGAGDMIKVMNEQSKKMITGRITTNGEVDVTL